MWSWHALQAPAVCSMPVCSDASSTGRTRARLKVCKFDYELHAPCVCTRTYVHQYVAGAQVSVHHTALMDTIQSLETLLRQLTSQG